MGSNIGGLTSPLLMPAGEGTSPQQPTMAFTYVPVPVYNLGGMGMQSGGMGPMQNSGMGGMGPMHGQGGMGGQGMQGGSQLMAHLQRGNSMGGQGGMGGYQQNRF